MHRSSPVGYLNLFLSERLSYSNLPSESVLASESRRKRSLFEGIVDGRWFDEELADAHSDAAEDLGNERRVRQTGHLRLHVRVQTFRVDVSEGGHWRRSGEATRQRLLDAWTTEHSGRIIA